MLQSRRYRPLHFQKVKAFTLIEVLIALSIVAISLVPLLNLLVTSISVMDSASCLSRASLIGNAKLAEVVGCGYPDIGTESGIIDDEGSKVVFEWQVNVTDVLASELFDIGLSGLRRVNVIVKWNQGLRQKHVSVSTYVTNNRLLNRSNLQANGISIQK